MPHLRLRVASARVRLKAEREASRPLEIVVCYEVGYDGFWLARLLIAKGPH
jgi:transposase